MSSTSNARATLLDSIASDSIHHSVANEAFQALKQMGMPHVKHEAFKYFKLGGLLNKELVLASKTIDESWVESEVAKVNAKHVLVTYNGVYLEQYSKLKEIEDELVILTLEQALKDYTSFTETFFKTWIEKEQDPFALLTLALQSQKGCFIYVPKKTQIKEELVLLELSDLNLLEESQVAFSSFVTLIALGQQAEAKFSKVTASKNQKGCAGSFLGYQLDQGAHLKHNALSDESSEYHFESIRVQQKKESAFKWVGAQMNPHRLRTSFHASLLEENISCEMFGLLALKDKQQAHIHILMEHLAPHCYSRQLFKHLLNHDSLASFEGKIWIDQKAQKTNAYQLNQNCLLSDDAQSYSKPNLEIFADDVKASHGSTTGQIDAEQLFYLQSRGLSKEFAQSFLLKGFCDEIALEAFEGSLQASMKEKIHSFLRS